MSSKRHNPYHRKVDNDSDTAAEDLNQAFEQARDLDGSMSERLGMFAERCESGTVFRACCRSVGQSSEGTRAGETAPKPGEIMPPFVLPDETGRLVSLERSVKAARSS